MKETIYYYPEEIELWTRSALVQYYNEFYYMHTELTCNAWVNEFIEMFCIEIEPNNIHIGV